MKLKKIGNLHIEPEADSKDTTFWKVQYIVIFFLFIFLLLVLLGYTGPGLLGETIIENKEKILIAHYQPYARQGAVTSVKLIIKDSADPVTKVFLSADYINQMDIKQVLPQPVRTEIKDNMFIYSFALEGNNNQVTFNFEPNTIGHQKLVVSQSNVEPIILSQWIYP